MMHFFFSLFFLVLIMALVFCYVAGSLSVVFMMHYIAKNRLQEMKAEGKSGSWRIFVKFLLFLVTGIGAGVIYLVFESVRHATSHQYVDTESAAVWNNAVLILVTVFLGLLIREVLRVRKKHQNDPEYQKNRFITYYTSKLMRNLAIFLICVMLTIFIGQRKKWAGADNAHLDAKQYWVAGQVLQGVRILLTSFIHPGFCLMTPLNSLQKLIFNRGIHFLPENDGERATWENAWFYYHYHRLHRAAFLTVDWKGKSPATVALLDRWWYCLENMATKPYADKQMEEEHYYQDYVNLAWSYSWYNALYTGSISGASARKAQHPEHVERSKKLAKWLTELGEKWQTTEKSRKLLVEFPKMEALAQYVLIRELETVIQGGIYNRHFDCEDSAIKQYVAIRQEFVKPASGLPAYRRMNERVAASTLYSWAIDGQKSMKYVINHYCGYEVAGKEDASRYKMSGEMEGLTAEEEMLRTAKQIFRDEIKIIEEINHGK